jgi:hypothetical protein
LAGVAAAHVKSGHDPQAHQEGVGYSTDQPTGFEIALLRHSLFLPGVHDLRDNERKDNNGRVIGYRGAYFARTPNAARKRFYVSGKTKTEIKAKLRKATSDRDNGFVFDAENLTVGRYLERWLPDSVKDTVKQTTYECYERLCAFTSYPRWVPSS